MLSDISVSEVKRIAGLAEAAAAARDAALKVRPKDLAGTRDAAPSPARGEHDAAAGLGFDPLPPDHPLWGMPNVILTPHVAGASPRIAERHLAVLLDNVRRFARGEPLATVVDKKRWF